MNAKARPVPIDGYLAEACAALDSARDELFGSDEPEDDVILLAAAVASVHALVGIGIALERIAAALESRTGRPT